MKRKYITLHDRTWKGKEWLSSYRSALYIRTLTDEEAATLDDIREYINLLKPIEENVVGRESGKLSCLKCGSKKGFYFHKMHRGKRSGWYNILKCAECGSRERQPI